MIDLAEDAMPARPARGVHRVVTAPFAPGGAAAWDAFVAASPGSTFCHLAGWQQVMHDVFGHEDRSLAAISDDGDIVGVLPLVRVRSRILGHYLISMPFLNAGGPLGHEDAMRSLVETAVAEGRHSNVDLLELRTRSELGQGLRTSNRRITVHLPLESSSDLAWKALPSKVRSQVRRAQKEGLTTTFGADQWRAFYALFADNMRRLGTPVLPARLFERLATTFPDQVEFGVVRLGDVPVAAGCGFKWQDQFEITWAASSRAHSRIAPNMLLYWEFMDRARHRGARTFDFGRCAPNSGTHAFKRQWGGHDVPLPWAQWTAREVTSTPRQDRGLFKVASTCWSHLPLSVTNRVGPWLAARLP